MTIAIHSVNVNGIRAAVRKGMLDWLDQEHPDIVTIQEVRAAAEVLESQFPEWNLAHAESSEAGRAGVAILSRAGLNRVSTSLRGDRFISSGRWVEAQVETADTRGLTVISAYVHTGEATDQVRMEEKLSFLAELRHRCNELAAEGGHVLLTGDLNIAHSELDIKNWKGNIGKAGFLPEEREQLSALVEAPDWVDLGRRFAGDTPGPYTWWSYRGKAFDNDAGWRIDYLIASADLADTAKEVTVHRSATYAERWSDHAAISAQFDLELSQPVL
jgi:exodeoxyribonuclease-3